MYACVYVYIMYIFDLVGFLPRCKAVEAAFSGVPRVFGWCNLRRVGRKGRLVNIIRAMYRNAPSYVT